MTLFGPKYRTGEDGTDEELQELQGLAAEAKAAPTVGCTAGTLMAIIQAAAA